MKAKLSHKKKYQGTWPKQFYQMGGWGSNIEMD